MQPPTATATTMPDVNFFPTMGRHALLRMGDMATQRALGAISDPSAYATDPSVIEYGIGSGMLPQRERQSTLGTEISKSLYGAVGGPAGLQTQRQIELGLRGYYDEPIADEKVRSIGEAMYRANIPRIKRLRSQLPAVRPEISALNDPDQGLLETFKGLLYDDPKSALQLLAITAGRAPEGLIGGALGGIMGGPLGAAVGGGLGGYSSEKFGGVGNQLEEMGIDYLTEEGAQQIIDNPGLIDEAFRRNEARARTIGIGSAVTAGIAGTAGRGIAQAARVGKYGRMAGLAGGAFGAGVVGEGGTELAAQIAAGERIRLGHVAAESVVGGLIDAPLTAISTAQIAATETPGSQAYLRSKLEAATRSTGLPLDKIIIAEDVDDLVVKLTEISDAVEDGPTKQKLESAIDELVDEQAARVLGETDEETLLSGVNVGEAGVALNIEDIYTDLRARNNGNVPTRQQVKTRVNQLLDEEIDTHGGIPAFFRANSSKIDAETYADYIAYLNKAYSRWQPEINEWLLTPDGAAYAPQEVLDKEGKVIEPTDQVKAGLAEEYIVRLRNLNRISQRGPLKQFVNKLRTMFNQTIDITEDTSKLGVELDDVRRMLDRISTAIATGQLDPFASTGVAPAFAKGKGGLESPSRRKFLKQAGGAVAGAVVDPSIILEPATPAAVETPMYTGMKEVFPGSIYEFSIATDPNAGWTSSDDPADGEIDVSFTHDPNTNEVIVYEEHAVVDTFEVDDMHADAEVLEYVRDKYGRKNINDVRVQREEMERDPVTGEGGFDYWGDADENFDNMAASLIKGEKTMAGVERVERGPAYDYFDEPTTPRLPELTTPSLPEPTTPRLDIDRRRETAIARATDANEDVRYSDLRMNSIREDWKNNELDLRREYGNFDNFEQAEWNLNYEMWIDAVQAAEQEVKSLPAPPRFAATRPLTPEDRINLEEAGEADALTLSVDNIYSTFDEDDTVADAIESGTLDNLVRMEAQNSNFTRQELWDAVNAREKTLADIEQESQRRVEARFAKSKSEMSAAEILNRDVRNEATKKYRKAINDSEISDDDKVERRKLLKDLLRPWGAEGIKRNIAPGSRDTFRQYAQMIVDGELDAVREFVRPLLDQIATQKAPSKTKTAKREYYAGYKGVSADELAEYRERGKTHPMEKKMTYPFADEEIDRLEEGREITVEEAENRRSVARELRSALQGKLPQTVKRKLTEIVYGIEDYNDITPWTDKYTATEVEGMGERAEVAQAEARRTRYEKTKLTSAQKSNILDDAITEEERIIIAAMEGDPSFENLTTPRERLLFLREPSPMSTAERAELNAFLADTKTFDPKKYKEQQAEKREEEVKGATVTRIPAVDTTNLRKEIALMWKEENRFKQMDPTVMERSIEDTSVEILDEESTDVATLTGEATPRWAKSLSDNLLYKRDKIFKTQERRLSADMFGSDFARITEEGRVAYDIIEELRLLEENKLTAKQYKTLIEKIRAFDAQHPHFVNFTHIVEEFAQVMEGSKIREEWNKFLSNKGIKSLRGETEETKRTLVIEWLETRGKNPPDYIKRRLYSELLGDMDTTILDEARDVLTAQSADIKGWQLEHGIGMADKIVLDNIVDALKKVLKSSELQSIIDTLHTEANVSVMVDFLNYFKKNITKGLKVNDRGEFENSADLETYDARADVLVDWWNKLNERLTKTNKDGKYTHGFLESHMLALKDTVNDNMEVLSAFDITDLDAIRDGLNKAQNFEGFESDFVNEYYNDPTNREKYALSLLMNPIVALNAQRHALAAIMHEGYVADVANWSKSKVRKDKGYSEHFNDTFWYRFTSYVWGKPVQAIRDVNKLSRFGTAQGTILAADKIADLIQRAHSFESRAKGEVLGTDLVQDTSLRSGEFYSRLFRVFARLTNRIGVINKAQNKELVDGLIGKRTKFSNQALKQASEELRVIMEDVYGYAKTETANLRSLTDEDPLDLRGHGDTLFPRVWNIEYLATRQGKAKLLRILSEAFSAPGKTTPVFEDAGLTVDDMYDVIINSGGFVQGEWTNLKADQTRTEKDIQKDLLVQEYLDSLETETLMDDNLVLDDVQAVIPRFIQKAIERTEYSKRFGKNDKQLRVLIKEGVEQIRAHNQKVYKMRKGEDTVPHIDEKRFEQAVWDMARILRNKYGYDMANMATRKWIQRGANFETIAKLPLVTLASTPEFFTPMLRGDVSPHHWFLDLMAGFAWAGYKGANGMSKLLFNKHLPAILKASKDIEGFGIISDVQLLRELGIADIQAMGDLVSTRYANPNFARGGLRAGAGGSIAGKIPKSVRAVFNMQTYMQATLLTTMTEMQQLMALRHFQRYASRRLKFLKESSGKTDARTKRLSMQYRRDLLDFGVNESIDLETSRGEAAFNAGALRFIDQVITRPNDATTAKAFKNPLLAPLVLFKRFITVFGNTLLTAVGNDFARTPSNIEKAKTVGQTLAVMTMMYGAVMFAEIMRGAIRGDLDDEDFEFIPEEFHTFVRRLDRTGLLTAPGTVFVNLAFPYKRGWWDTTEGRVTGELLGPLGGDVFAFGDTLLKNTDDAWWRLVRQLVPTSKALLPKPKKKSKKTRKSRKIEYKLN